MAYTNKVLISERFRTACLLALVGGFMDIYTYLLKGQVFATAETGNLILLGIHVTQGDWRVSMDYLFPILFFSLGILASESIRKFFRRYPHMHWRQIVLLVEMLTLFAIAFIENPAYNIIVNSTISFVSSIQIQSFRKVHGHPFMSTMCTGNLRSGTESLYFYYQQEKKEKSLLHKALRYYSIILCFVTGAISGAACIQVFAEKAVFVTLPLLGFVFYSLFEEERED